MKSFIEIKELIKKADYRIHLLLISLISILIVYFAFLNMMNRGKYAYNVGDISQSDIVLSFDIIDVDATEIERIKAESKVTSIMYIDHSLEKKALSDLEILFKNMYDLKEDYGENPKTLESIFVKLQENNQYGLSEQQLEMLISAKTDDLKHLESYSHSKIKRMMSQGITGETIGKVKNEIEAEFESILDMENAYKSLGAIISQKLLFVNMFVDEEATEERMQFERSKVKAIVIKEGTILIGRNEVVTENTYKMMEDNGLLKARNLYERLPFVGVGIVIIISFAIMAFYLSIFHKSAVVVIRKIYLVYIIFFMVFLSSGAIYSISKFLVPVAILSMLVGIIENSRMAIVFNLFLSLFIGLLTGGDISSLMLMVIGGTVGGITISKANSRGSIFLAGVMVAIVNATVILGLGLYQAVPFEQLLVNVFYGMGNGLLCSIITVGSLPLWEFGFKVMTPIKLLELSNPNHTLLKKILVEAPGTYHHSIIVGNLSEAAAHDIGGDSLLARVGSYYHDLGKVERAHFFKENQYTSDNPHDRLVPRVSADIIKQHTSKGVELAKKNKLPSEIIDFIREHHGTTVIRYFYSKALDSAKDKTSVSIESYTYDGPRPSSKEIAIVMLADSIEAAVRTIQDPQKGSIEAMVKKIVEDKLLSGQLNDSDLTLSDLEIIQNTFVKILLGIYHERVEYPDLEKEEE